MNHEAVGGRVCSDVLVRTSASLVHAFPHEPLGPTSTTFSCAHIPQLRPGVHRVHLEVLRVVHLLAQPARRAVRATFPINCPSCDWPVTCRLALVDTFLLTLDMFEQVLHQGGCRLLALVLHGLDRLPELPLAHRPEVRARVGVMLHTPLPDDQHITTPCNALLTFLRHASQRAAATKTARRRPST